MNCKTFVLVGLCFLFSCSPKLHSQDVAGGTDSLIASDVSSDNNATVDRQAEIERVIEAGKTDNQVQAHLDYLTNRIGPRLTGSEGLQAACEWSRDKFTELGLESRLEQWGEFPVGFERGPAYGMMVTPKKMKLEFGTNAWSAGTKGNVVRNVVLAPQSLEQLDEMRDAIEGNFVLMQRTPSRRWRSAPQPVPAKPESQADQDATSKGNPNDGKNNEKPDAESDNENKNKENKAPEPKPLTREQLAELKTELMNCNPAGLIRSTSENLILTGGNYQVDMDSLPQIPEITLLREQWDQINELLEAGEEVQLSFDIRNHFRKGPIPLFNVIAEIPGTEWPEECVIVGGHLDSWDGATGATDNAAGCATTIEAARILMAAGVKPRRTIRFMLWSGEEQGLLGSRAYVEQNRDAINKHVSAVFVHDGGTNYVAGIRCTEAMKADFEKVFAPAMELDERAPFEISVTEAIRPRGGSDHVPFIRAGVPGFFWSQRGRTTYRTTHHTQFDTYDSVVPEYQKHSSIVIALGALGTANLDHLLPRDGVTE